MNPAATPRRAAAGSGLPLRNSSVSGAVDAFCRGFAGPFMPFDDPLMTHMVVEHARETIGLFLELHDATLPPQLRAFIRQGVLHDVPFDGFWSPAFGRVMAAVRDIPSRVQLLTAAVDVAWTLAEHGMEGEWSATLEVPPALRIGAVVLPPASSITVRSAEGQLDARLADGAASREYRFVRTRSGWNLAAGGNDLETNVVVGGVELRIAGVVSDERHAYLSKLILSGDEAAEAVAAHVRAMDLLDRSAPSYAQWVRRYLRAVIPLQTRTGEINSGSSRDEPGVIHASIDCPVEGYCEMLVHEVSHQTFYALTRMGPVDDGSDSVLYYSPVKETGRPIGMILLAYHAFANVVLLGRVCRMHPLLAGNEYFTRNERHLIPILAKLDEALRTTRALTRIGRALYEPLAAQLQKTSEAW